MNTLRLLLLIATLLSASELTARNFRVIGPPNGGIPNGTRFDGVGCINCHFNPAGAGLRNNFGNAVFSAIGGSSGNIQFWNAAFAALDSDNDGFTNGEELGDEDGDGVPERTTGITNPGDPQSKPALNTTPVFTSSPLIGATKGINYAYQATATDPDQQSLSFFKVSGPSWLTVSIAGLVSGTPPDDANTTAAVTIRVIDNGSPPASADHSFNINLIATFLGWQRLNFASGENDPNAGSALDPENDRVPNFIEYALRGSPVAVNGLDSPQGFDGANGSFYIDIRDDDPQLSVTADVSSQIPFSSVLTLTPIVTDPIPNDGFKRLTFIDPVASGPNVNRFVRLKFTNGQ